LIFKSDKFILNEEEKNLLKCLIAKGTPNHYRANLWLLCSRAKQDIACNPLYYDNLLKLTKEVPTSHENQIDKDIKRTSAKSLSKNPELKIKMKNVLMCYSIRNSSIGYCQGFNFLVLRLLEVLNGGEVIINF